MSIEYKYVEKARNNSETKKIALNKLAALYDLSQEIIEDITERVLIRCYKPNNFIFIQGDIIEIYIVILEGWLKVIDQTKFDREITIDVLGPGNTLGEINVFTGEPSRVSVKAITEVKILIIYKNDFFYLINKHPELARNIILLLAKRVNLLSDSLVASTIQTVEQRVERALQMLDNILAEPLIITHQDIANMAGTTRATASRVLEKLKALKVISYQRGRLVIRDKKRLNALYSESFHHSLL
jgi:CRP-like cAMP-binding protein